MTRKSKQSFVDDMIGLLVKEFGVDRIRSALAASSAALNVEQERSRIDSDKARPHSTNPTVTAALEQLRLRDEEKYHLLFRFHAQLKDRSILKESQDIRHFAQLIGLKELLGKSRKEMIPGLMRFLLEQPIEQLRIEIEDALRISEQERQKGFSVLTDKLLGGKPAVDAPEEGTTRE